MKRWYIILSGILVLIILIVVVMTDHIPFGRKNSILTVRNPGSITRILIQQADNKVDLHLYDGEWWVGDLGHARKSAIEFLMTTIGTMEIKSPLSEDMARAIEGNDPSVPVRVKIFGKPGIRVITSFFISREDSSAGKSLVRRREGSRPFLVDLPGYDVDPVTAFVAEPKFWLPYLIYDLDPSEISEISVTYGNEPDPQIRITRNNDDPQLFISGTRATNFDTVRVTRYLTYFSSVPFERWANENDLDDKIAIKGEPYANIRVNTAKGDTVELSTWVRYMVTPEGNVKDTDRLWGSLNRGKDIFIVRYYDLDPIIKTPDYFIPPSR